MRGPLPCPAVFPDFITFIATVARGRALSRRARPCPHCAAGRTYLALVPLTVPVHRLPSAAGDELRKGGGNTATQVPRADRTEQPQGWAPNLGIRCAVLLNGLIFLGERPHNSRPAAAQFVVAHRDEGMARAVPRSGRSALGAVKRKFGRGHCRVRIQWRQQHAISALAAMRYDESHSRVTLNLLPG